MPSLDKGALLSALAPPLDSKLTEQLLDEFVSLEKRFVLRDWEPATLDGGQLAEAGARIVYHQDSTTLNSRKPLDDCLSYVEDPKNQNRHSFPDRRSSIHLCKVLRSIYKFRSTRGAVHIDPVYTANHLDSKFVLENARWVLSEILRVFWTGDRARVAAAIRQIVQYDIPAIGEFDGNLLVQRTDCSPEEEVLILLHYVGEAGLSRRDLGRFVRSSPPSVTRAVQGLEQKRQIVALKTGAFRLTDLGIRRVLSDLAAKLAL
jgi:hypothetical protein